MGDPPEATDLEDKSPLGRRLTKYALMFAALIALLIVLVWIGNFVWYRTQMPIRFTSANWTGTWKTQQYGLSGKLLVHLPDPLPADQDFKADALVYYPIYSVWKTGQFVKMEFVGNFSPDSSAASGESQNPIQAALGKLKFKATAGDQVVDYVAMMDESGTRIIGSYVSQSPSDIGYFIIWNY